MPMLTSRGLTYNISGSIKHMGIPVAHVIVRLISGEQGTGEVISESKTTSKGDFQFAVEPGTYGLIVLPDSGTCFVPRYFEELAITGNTTLNITLNTGVILSGKLLGISGENFEKCQVLSMGFEATAFRQSAAVEKNGRYNMVLPKGKYHVALRSMPMSKFISTRVESIELIHDMSLDFDLSGLSRFKGQVEDVNGNPVPASSITIRPSANQSNHLINQFEILSKCQSDQSGEFEIAVSPADYDFAIEPAEFSPLAESQVEAVYIAPGSTKTFVLDRGFRISGKVEFDGNGLSGCEILVANKEAKFVSSLKTDDRGRFVINVAQGNYEITARPIISKSVSDNTNLPVSEIKEIIVQSDQDLGFQLKKGVAVRGVVRDNQGESRPDVSVSFITDSGFSKGRVATTTTSDGSYFLVVEPGKYIVCLNEERDKSESLIVPPQGLEQDFVCQGACVVRLKVVSEDEEPVSGCHVSWGPYVQYEGQLGLFAVEESNLSQGVAITDEQGICQMTLAQGVYTFRFLPHEEGNCDERTIRQLSISGDMKRKVKLTFKSS